MSATLYCGDVRDVLATLPERSVQCVVTSPPYFGLRDYGTATCEGGADGCDHRQEAGGTRNKGRDRAASGGTFHDSPKVEPSLGMPYRDDCGKCGARRVDAQLGLERTPDAYVAAMVGVFRAVKRVLRDDGTLWLNLGDSYAGSWGNQGRKEERGTQRPINGGMLTPVHDGRFPAKASNTGSWVNDHPSLKPKDLVGVPWRVAFALQADGWYLRSDIIWAKPNPMPESVTDRPTKAHEYLFLLTKSERYYYDQAAIFEQQACSQEEAEAKYNKQAHKGQRDPGGMRETTGGFTKATFNPAGRNARTVWTIATQPYSGAHFATFPEELARRCILAGSRPGDTVLDPFGGSGTVASVATGHGRHAIHIDLNPAYIELARQRIGPMICEDAA